MSRVPNPYEVKTVAQRYDRGRPYFHSLVIEKVRKKLGLTSRVRRALDVGCGTGLSTRALLDVADQVDAIDASQSMLDVAFPDPRIMYRRMRAERLDFPDESFDLITLCQVLHWIDDAKFFPRARRVLTPKGTVVIYDNFFLWNTDEGDPLSQWFRQRYETQFPSPTRGRVVLTARGELIPEGFVFAGCEEYSCPDSLTCRRLIDHLLTRGSVAAAVDQSGESVERAVQWLENELRPFFASTPAILFPFGGFIYYLTRA